MSIFVFRVGLLLTFAFAICTGDVLYAQPVPSREPSATHIYPAGARRGSKVRVRVGAECLPPRADFFVLGQGLSAPARLGGRAPEIGEPSPRRVPTEVPISYPKEWQSEIAVAADAPLGFAHWRVSCAQGGTQPMPFVVGDLPEHLERESNSTPERAERVSSPVTLNGQICGENDMDYYRVRLERGALAVVDVLAGRLGSRLDPIVEVTDPSGNRPPMWKHHVGNDPVLAFAANSTGDYQIRIANVSFHGGPAHVYRINLTTRPYPLAATPAGGRAGQAAKISFQPLGGGPPIVQTVKFPSRPGLFLHHSEELAAPVLLSAETEEPRAEVEPNLVSKPETIAQPAVVYGRWEDANDQDCFRISLAKGAQLSLKCEAFPPGSAALPVLRIVRPQEPKKPLAERLGVQAEDGVSRLQWTAPETADYLIVARDLRFGGRGGPAFSYRLAVRAAQPDFEIFTKTAVAHVAQGGQVVLQIQSRRHGGFNGPIRLLFHGLPEHVKPDKSEIPAGKASVKVTLKASKEAHARSSLLRIEGEAVLQKGASPERRSLEAPCLAADDPGDRSRVFLTVKHLPVFRLFCSEAYLYAHRGSIFPYPMQIERLNGFKGPIQLQIGDRQNRDLDGVQMVPTTVPPDQTEFFMPIYLPESMHINVQSQSQLYTQAYAQFKDAQGREQSVLVVSEKRNMLRTRPPVAKLSAVRRKVTASAIGLAAIPLQLKRTSNFPGAMKVALRSPVPEGVIAETLVIPAGEETGEVYVQLSPVVRAQGKPIRVTLEGRGAYAGGVQIVSETDVQIVPVGAKPTGTAAEGQ